VLRYSTSPLEILGGERVEGVRVVRNELVPSTSGLSARATDETEVIQAGLVLRSIGYRGSPIAGVPFDERRATIHNDGGRVTDEHSGKPVPGLYTAGWIKRGPSGVIGTNKKCANETVGALLADLTAGLLATPTIEPEQLLETLERRGVRVVDYTGWEAIDAHERATGEPHGRPRVKLTSRDQMLRIASR